MNITYLHGEPTPRKELEPFDVVQGSFHAQLYDINSLLDLPLANVRKLWKIMLSAAWENEKSIDQVRGWLPRAAENAAVDIRLAENALEDAKTAAAARHAVKDAQRRLTNCKARQEKVQKLQAIFDDMAAKAKI